MDLRDLYQYFWAGFVIVWIIWAIWTKPTQRRESLAARSLYGLVTLAGSYVMFGGQLPGSWFHLRLYPPARWIEILGLVVTAAGLGFAIWARAYLGGNWSGAVSVKVGHELVRTGPYHWVRHPIYSGITLALLGTALGIGQTRGFVAVVLLYAGFKIKSRLEERVMCGVFGAEYDEYRRSTGAIVPRLRWQ
jgi:protein-S-isoprenylcysteine O-methyltransferase Ste14